MADEPDILEQAIAWLEKEKRQGRRRIRLSAEAKRAFAAAKPASAAKSAPPPARSSATVATPPHRYTATPVPAAPGGTPAASRQDAGAPVFAPPGGTPAVPMRPGNGTPGLLDTRPSVVEQPSDLSPLDLSMHTLETLPAVVAACTRCRLHALGRTKTVFSDGSPKARLMFIGEGPGADEDAQGVPFVGAAGQLLTKMIQAMRLKREEVYIANIVKCRPPGNRTPADDEGAACLPYLQRQVELVKPEVIVVLGAVPFLHLLGRKGIMSGRGKWYEYRGIPVMATYHPAFLLRTPGKKGETWTDLQQVMKRLGIQ